MKPFCEISDEENKVKTNCLDLYIDWGFHPKIDIFKATISSLDIAKKLLGKHCIIKLGYIDGDQISFKHLRLESIKTTPRNIKLELYNRSIRVSKSTISGAIENSTAGDIIRTLFENDENIYEITDEGLRFEQITCIQRSFLDIIYRLAKMCDLFYYVKEDGKIFFGKIKDPRKHEAIYGENIIDINYTKHMKREARAIINVESPESSMGRETWHWITKNPIKVEVGPKKAIYWSYCFHEIRSEENARKVGENLLKDAERRRLNGTVTIVGNPLVRPGDILVFKNISDLENIEARIYGVEHIFNLRKGFFTTLRWCMK